MEEMQPIDWDKISRNKNLTVKFISKNADKLNWNILWVVYPVEFLVEKFPERVDWSIISVRRDLSLGFLRKYAKNLNWDTVSLNYPLTDDFLTQFKDFVDWCWVIRCRDIPDSFLDLAYKGISKKASILDWETITMKRTLTPSFVEKFKEWLDWTYITMKRGLFTTFVTKYPDRIDWMNAPLYQNLTDEQIREHAKELDWLGVSYHQALSEEIIREFSNKLDWYYVCQHQRLSESIIEEFSDKVIWLTVSMNQLLSEDFIEKHIEKLDLKAVAERQILSEDFIERHIDELDLKILSKNQKLSPEFRKKYGIKGVPKWLYLKPETKKSNIVKCRLYDCFDDYFIAYKAITSVRQCYHVGETYISSADHTTRECSFGLTASSMYTASSKIKRSTLKLKIRYEDVAQVFREGHEIRCTRFEVLEEF